MAGRRVRSHEECHAQIQALLDLYASIPHPPGIAGEVWNACVNSFNVPPSIRDPEQLKADIAEAIELATFDGYCPPEIFPKVFWAALSLVSAREHIVLQPGRKQQGERLQ